MKTIPYVAVLLLIAGMPGLVPLASAQTSSHGNTDTLRVRDGRTTIVIEPGGRVVIDGDVVDREDGAVVLRIDPEEQDVVVVERGDGERVLRLTPPAFSFPDDFAEDLERNMERLQERLQEHRVELGAIRIPELDDLGARLDEHLRPLEGAVQERAEVARMEHEARRLARAAREADGRERQRLEEELRAHLDTLFTRKMELRRERLAQQTRRLEREREQLDERRAARQEIIDRRLRELLGDGEVFEW